MKKYLSVSIKNTVTLLTILFFVVVFSFKIVNASGILAVTGVTSLKVTGIANDTYGDGWKWIFHVTLPSSESVVKMKFDDFSNGLQTIPANNIRLYSPQSTNSNNEATAINISSQGVYSDQININTALDLDPITDGIQIDINVDSKIPFGIVGTGYNTNYDITSEAPEASTTDKTPDAEVYATTTQISSGLCLSLDVPKDLQMRVAVSGGEVVFGTTTRAYPAFTVSSPSDQNLVTYGNDWYLNIGVFPNLLLNTYSLITFNEAQDPFMVGSSTILGRIKFDNVGNITYLESINPNCPKVDVPIIEKPIISSNAPTDVTQVAGMQFSDPLATASDSLDGDITGKLVYSNNINIWTPGDYRVDVNVVNSRGYRANPFTQYLHLLPMTPDMIAKKDLDDKLNIILAPFNSGVYKVGTNSGEYPLQARDELFAEMTNAISVKDNPASTASDYISAQSKLDSAMAIFMSKQII